MGWFKRISLLLTAFIVLAGTGAVYIAQQQGLPDQKNLSYRNVRIEFDEQGIPTLTGGDWKELIQAQGYVTAGHRLWQMDLIRRKVSGRLSAWFGPKALEHDLSKQREDRLAVAQREADAMPQEERAYCNAFADGVNDFIENYFWRWGLEYILLRAKPEPWACRDSLLVLLEMNDSLTATADEEAEQFRWKRHLPTSWQKFLFGAVHPWNKAYFDQELSESFTFPDPKDYLSASPITEPKTASHDIIDPDPVGSNSWGWVGESGYFLANDPHLSYAVPAIWYAIRLRKDAENWIVGTTIPGIPGVTIGMTPYYAWTFTNSGEDVDDYVRETVSPDLGHYLVSRANGEERWEPIHKKLFAIEVKGKAKPELLEAFFTRRGPLVEKPELGPGYYARQWLPLKAGMLRLPTFQLLLGQNLEDFQKAIDHMRVPSQNALVMDRLGNLAYRMTGTGIIRKVSAPVPVEALDGEWDGFEAAGLRRRLLLSNFSETPKFLATANERIWVDPNGGHWASEDRKARIIELLSEKSNLSQVDMTRIQLDTTSRFRKLLLSWLNENSSKDRPHSAQMLASWKAWDGNSRSDSKIFAQSTLAEKIMSEVLLDRIKQRFLDEKDRSAPYMNYARRNWLTAILEVNDESGVQAFGVSRKELADYVVEKVWNHRSEIKPHEISNAIETQHPFATRLPYIGRLFATKKSLQWGAGDLVLAEKPSYGPSMRIVWNLKDPLESTWSLPIGQSGHIHSKFYANLQGPWENHQTMPVFDRTFTWNLVKLAQPGGSRPTQR